MSETFDECIETESRPNRRARRRFGLSHIGIMTEEAIEQARGKRRRYRRHVKRMKKRR